MTYNEKFSKILRRIIEDMHRHNQFDVKNIESITVCSDIFDEITKMVPPRHTKFLTRIPHTPLEGDNPSDIHVYISRAKDIDFLVNEMEITMKNEKDEIYNLVYHLDLLSGVEKENEDLLFNEDLRGLN